MKKYLLILFFILGTFQSILAQHKPNIGIDDSVTYFVEHDRQALRLNTGHLLVKFKNDLNETEKKEFLKKYINANSLNFNILYNFNKLSLYEINYPGISPTKLKKLLYLMNLDKEVDYANPLLENSDGSLQGITDRFVVCLKSTDDYELLAKEAQLKKFKIIQAQSYNKQLYFAEVTKASAGNALEISNLLSSTKLFNYAEPDFLLLLHKFNTNDTYLNYQWALHNTGSSIQFNGQANADMKLFDAWTISAGSSMIKVAILDEGVDLVHPDLAGNLLPGFDATMQGSNGAYSGQDAHGTACAGIVAAVGNNQLGIAGVAYQSKILPVRIAYSSGGYWVTSQSWIAAAIDWAWDQGGADVLSNSWGGGSPSNLINEAIYRATTLGRGGKGCPVFFAAGNGNGTIQYPATLSNVIAVMATSMCNQRKNPSSCDGENSWGSNYGMHGDIAAPGTKIFTTDISGPNGYTSGDYTAVYNGTSASTANAAGVMALILSINPMLTMSAAREILESTCDKVGSYTYYAGIANQPNGTWSNDLGYGCINAYTALQMANPQACNNPPVVANVLASTTTICSPTSINLSLIGMLHGNGQLYQWQSSSDNIVYTNIVGATAFSYSPSVSTTTWFRCNVNCGISTASNPVQISYINPTIQSYPYSENFDLSHALPCGWTVDDMNNDGYTWSIQNNLSKSPPHSLIYQYNGSLAANDWAYSPPLTLNAGSHYRIKCWLRAQSASLPEKLEIKWGQTPNLAGMTSSAIFSDTNIINTNFQQITSSLISPNTSGTYYIGFGVFSQAGMFNLAIDDITIEAVAPCINALNGGSIAGPLNLTAGIAATYTLTGSTGNNYQWQQSNNGGISWNDILTTTNPSVPITLSAGQWMLRVVSNLSGSSCADVYSNSLSIQVNDLLGNTLSNPIPIALPFQQYFSTAVGAGFTTNYNGPQQQTSPDIFFSFSSGPCADSILISSCGSNFDTYIHLLDSSGQHILSNDDNGPLCSGPTGSIKKAVTPNTTYIIVFEGYSVSTGTINVTVQETNLMICSTELKLKLFLQGYYIGSSLMTAVMNNQSFMGMPLASSLDVDDIEVEIRESYFPFSLVQSKISRLKTNGFVDCSLTPLSGNYYVVIKHRNSVCTWTKLPVNFNSQLIQYDFTTNASKAYGNNMIEVEAGIWALFTGELDNNGNIDLQDYSMLETDVNSFHSGYFASDLNGDGNTDLFDIPVLELNMNQFIFTQQP